MKIVTGGAPFIDIDAYGCIVAYAELLNKQGISAQAFSSSVYNESITKTVQAWNLLPQSISVGPEDTFIVLDASNPESIDREAPLEKIEQIIDHRHEFIKSWKTTGVKLQIEEIGAAATYVYEEWEKAGLLSFMSLSSIRLLYTAIIDNTLNLQSKVTTNRDKRAYIHLKSLAQLPEKWPEMYFIEVEQAILADIHDAINNDSKLYKSPHRTKPIMFMQLCVWDSDSFIQPVLEALRTHPKLQSPWLLNLATIKQNQSLFVVDNLSTAKWLNNTLKLRKTDKNMYVAERMYLRKEIIQKDKNEILNK